MSDSYVLHDVMRKVKADGLFDSIRRDLISDIEQKPSYLDLKSQIESLMSSYLSEHKWSSSLKKSDLRERARRHIETSDLIKDTLPTLVNQYMQTCQEQLIQPRLLSFVSDHLEHVYHSIGGTHVYRPSTSYTPTSATPQEPVKSEPKPPSSTIPIKKEPNLSKPKLPMNKTPQTSDPIKKKVIPKEKPISMPKETIKEEKKTRILSPVHSPNDLVDISPSPTSMDNERLSPSPPPPVVRIASPLSSNKETARKIKRASDTKKNDDSSTMYIKKKKIKTEDHQQKNVSEEKVEETVLPSTTSNEIDTRKLRHRRPNPKYLNEQFETDDFNIVEPISSPPSPSPTLSKPKKMRQLKSSTSFEQEQFDTPSSPPPAPPETTHSTNDMSPEYGTTLPSSTIDRQQPEVNDEQSRTPSPVTTESKKSTSPRRLRPRKAHERSSIVDNQTGDPPKIRESARHRPESTSIPSVESEETDVQPTTMKKTRHPSASSLSSGADNNSNELPSRSISVPDNLTTNTDESSPTPVSKSFIWKPKISK